MNGLLNGFGNILKNTQRMAPIQQINQQASAPNILMQAIGAAMRGESPQVFMQNLASTHPQLRQYDLSNLEQAAQQVCQQNGVDMQQAINQIDNITSNLTQSTQ